MSKKSVWVVDGGDYSDYRVAGIFSTKENAEKFLNIVKSGDLKVDEWPLNPAIEETAKGLSLFRLNMSKDGAVNNIYKETYTMLENPAYLYTDWRDKTTKYLLMTTWAKDEQHAIKIANEKRVQFIANNEW